MIMYRDDTELIMMDISYIRDVNNIAGRNRIIKHSVNRNIFTVLKSLKTNAIGD